MKKICLIIISLCIFANVNVNASTVKKVENNKYNQTTKSKKEVINLKEAKLVIFLVGGCFIVHNIIQNKSQKK